MGKTDDVFQEIFRQDLKIDALGGVWYSDTDIEEVEYNVAIKIR